ncbi:hypothetical protein Agabi119p4_9726 [Agaricus bisporus var. burnettii]|uniref:Uncharacterized protein n=1 Tax=Agaricus bisporus var. burnettii TaxID=192524 RepID=A0A8H7C550_AGABI|nr:hypothetical protein Agabi119p4_9726 [Agaricus bisporus var. burnettii]
MSSADGVTASDLLESMRDHNRPHINDNEIRDSGYMLKLFLNLKQFVDMLHTIEATALSRPDRSIERRKEVEFRPVVDDLITLAFCQRRNSKHLYDLLSICALPKTSDALWDLQITSSMASRLLVIWRNCSLRAGLGTMSPQLLRVTNSIYRQHAEKQLEEMERSRNDPSSGIKEKNKEAVDKPWRRKDKPSGTHHMGTGTRAMDGEVEVSDDMLSDPERGSDSEEGFF